MTSLSDLQEKTILLATEFIGLLNSTLHNVAHNDKAGLIANAAKLDEKEGFNNTYELMITQIIEEVSSVRNNLADDLPNIRSLTEKATSAIYVVRNSLIKVGHYTEMTAFGSIPVLFLSLCLIVGYGVGRVFIPPSIINGTYSRFLSYLVLPLFVLVITCCIIGFTTLGLLSVITAGKI